MTETLPKTWNWRKIGDLCTVVRGASPRPKGDPRYFGGQIPWITIRDVTKDANKYLFTTREHVTVAGAEKSRLLKKGDFILSNSGTVCVPKILGVAGCIHDGFVALLEPSNEIDKDYLFHFFNHIREVIRQKHKQGVTQTNLNTGIVKNIEIPLPPLAEQRKIAAVLDRADALRRQRQASLAKLDTLTQAVFLDMFGDPVTNPKGWPRKLLGDVCETQLGKMLSKKAKRGINPKKYLRNASVQWRRFELSNLPEMDFSNDEMKKFELKYGDVLVCEGGEVGRSAVWRQALTDCYYQKALHRVRSSILAPEYIQEYFFWMSSLGGLRDATSSATIAHLTAERLKRLRVPVPPRSLQHQFSRLYGKVSSIEAQLVAHLNKTEDSFNALMQKAFKGELQFNEAAFADADEATQEAGQLSLFSA